MTDSFWPALHGTARRIGYARVSTSEQRMDIQLEALEAVKCDEIFTDHGVSGGKAERAGLDDLLKTLQRGDVLVVFKLDRLGRSVLHLADLLTRFRREGIHFCSLAEGVNTTTPGGKLVYHVFAAVAEFQRDMISENTALGIAAARARGEQIGRPHKLSACSVVDGHRIIMQQGISISEMARRMDVSHSTLTRAFKRYGLSLLH